MLIIIITIISKPATTCAAPGLQVGIRNRVEPGQILVRTEPNRTDDFSKSPEPKRIEPNRFLPDLCSSGSGRTRAAARRREPARSGTLGRPWVTSWRSPWVTSWRNPWVPSWRSPRNIFLEKSLEHCLDNSLGYFLERLGRGPWAL